METNITITDLIAIRNTMNLAAERGAFKAEEMADIGAVYNKLNKFLEAVIAQAAAQEAEKNAREKRKALDDERTELEVSQLWSLGLGEPFPVSALHGRGSGDLLDEIIKRFPEEGSTQARPRGPRRVALLGKPNVGKSSLLNALAGESRSVVSSVAGTTVDPVDELIEIAGTTYRIIDTAGIRRKSHQDSGTDYYASLRTISALERAELAVVLFDANSTITEQDLRILTMVEEMGRALVIVMNKWDLVDDERREQLEKELDRNLERYPWAQKVNVSALTGWHRDRLAPAIRTALNSWEKRIQTSKLNAFLGALVSATPPPVRGGKQPKIKFATQAGICPPKFVIFATDFVEQAYRKFIERRLTERVSLVKDSRVLTAVPRGVQPPWLVLVPPDS
mgnify:CR=1 FL=1